MSSYILFFIILWFTWLHVTLLDVRFSVDSVYERVCKAMHFAVMAAFSSVSTDWDPFSPDDVDSVRSLKTMTLTLMFSRIVLGIQYIVIMVYGRSRRKAVVPTGIHAIVMFISAGVYLGVSDFFDVVAGRMLTVKLLDVLGFPGGHEEEVVPGLVCDGRFRDCCSYRNIERLEVREL